MAPILSFSGLASGIDWQGMVDQIIQVESRPVRLFQNQIDDAQNRSSAWSTFRGRVETIEARAAELAGGSAFQAFNTSVSFLGAASNAPLSAQPSADAIPGSYQVRVVQLATREKLGSDVFSSRTAGLGIEGEFIINGRSVSVGAEDSLNDIVDAINRSNTGSTRSGVTASILHRGPDAYSMVLTADATGAEGVGLADGSGGALKALGFLDTSTQIKHQTSDGATSDRFSNSGVALASTLGLTATPSPGDVTLGGFTVNLDLQTMSLDNIAAAINTAAAGAGSAVTAAVVGETGEDGTETYHLDINGTTAFSDANGILETLGILEAGRSDVAQEISSVIALTDGDASTAASGATLLQNLWVNGSGAGVQVGDTLTFAGTRGDGSAFTMSHTVAAGGTLQDVVDALNSAVDGFQTGDRTATASISAEGRLVVTDDQSDGSWLALDIVAHNEGGGTLDFGDFSVTQAGRAREIAAGQDALLEVDGAFMTRSSNVVPDAITGVTLRLHRASDTVATIDVTRNNQATVEPVQAFIQAFNELSQWVADQFSGVSTEARVAAPPLSGDSVLRQMRDTLKNAMLTELAALVGGDLTRLADIGIEINKKGRFDVDAGELLEAIENDPAVVQRLFGVYGSGSTSALGYISSGSATRAGNYQVEISQAATRASVSGAGFSGAYVDDGTPDTLTARDLATGSEYSISLTNGMNLAEVIQALNSEFATPKAHEVQASTAMYGDALGTAATDATLLRDLFDAAGNGLGVADGDVISISGTRADGSSFLEEFIVSDGTTQTLGELRSAVANALGSGEEVTWESGRLTASALKDGSSSLAFSITSDNAGGGSLSFGSMDVSTPGRGTVGITASSPGGDLTLQHEEHGSSSGFEVSFTPGGSDGSASLGLAPGSYAGLDVVGTIGGYAATGSGQILTGDDGTSIEGLMIRYEGADTGLVGTMLFSRGAASAVENAAKTLLGSGPGSIDGIVGNIDPLIDRLNDRIENLENRMVQRRQFLLKKFARLEEALALAQSQSEWLTSQFANLPSYSRNKS